VFFVLGTPCYKVKYREKAEKGLHRRMRGRRGAKHAFANGLAALILGVLAWVLDKNDMPGTAAILNMPDIAGLSRQRFRILRRARSVRLTGKTTILLTSFKRVQPGTEGAVSLEGTVAGIIASMILAALLSRSMSQPDGRGSLRS